MWWDVSDVWCVIILLASGPRTSSLSDVVRCERDVWCVIIMIILLASDPTWELLHWVMWWDVSDVWCVIILLASGRRTSSLSDVVICEWCVMWDVSDVVWDVWCEMWVMWWDVVWDVSDVSEMRCEMWVIWDVRCEWCEMCVVCDAWWCS